MPAFGGRHHDRALFLDAERRLRLGFGLRQGLELDRLPLAVEAIELGGDSGGFDRIVLEQEIDAEIGAADAAAGIDARAEQKAEMPGFRRTGKPRHIHQAGMPDAFAAAQRDQPLGDEGAVETDQRHDIGDGAQRHIIEEAEQIGLRPIRRPEAALAQHAVERDDGHEDEPDRGEMPEARKVVAAVRIDDGDRRRQNLVGLMVIDDDDIDAELLGFGERLDAGGAAIDADEKRRAALGERTHGLNIRAHSLRTGDPEYG